ncbi:MAG: coiled-coil domain-containing protein [Promethearchaeota archaeon]
MLRTSVHFITGLDAWKFVTKLVLSHDQVKVGKETARMVARLVLEDPDARVRHSHGPSGSDITGRLRIESKYKAHLLSNLSRIVDKNVEKYKSRKAREDGIAMVTAGILARPGEGFPPDDILPAATGHPKTINTSAELIALVVLVLHDAGEKHLVVADKIIEAAKESLSEEFPDQNFHELDRDELLAVVQFNGLKRFSEQLDILENQIHTHETRFDSLEGKVDSLDGKVDSLDGKVDSLEGKVDSLDGKVDSLEGKVDSLEGKVDSLAALLEKILEKLEE